MQTKICTKCGVEKDIEEFVKNKNCKDGCENRCKKCLKKYNKKYYEENKIKINNKIFYINTAPPELKEALQALIDIRNKNKLIKELKNG